MSLPSKTRYKVKYDNDDWQYREMQENCIDSCPESMVCDFNLRCFEVERDGGKD